MSDTSKPKTLHKHIHMSFLKAVSKMNTKQLNFLSYSYFVAHLPPNTMFIYYFISLNTVAHRLTNILCISFHKCDQRTGCDSNTISTQCGKELQYLLLSHIGYLFYKQLRKQVSRQQKHIGEHYNSGSPVNSPMQ